MNNVIAFARPLHDERVLANLLQIPQSVEDAPNHLAIPLFQSKISAGFPSPADDYREESLDLNQYMIAHRASTFVFTVKGDSMVAAGILDGDKLVVDRAIEPKHNQIVVAVVNSEYTVKRLFKWRGVVELRAENPAYKAIQFKDNDELTIWGVVVGVLRKFKL
jgi:DNA polymerase V